jgi:hypothetical protein
MILSNTNRDSLITIAANRVKRGTATLDMLRAMPGPTPTEIERARLAYLAAR